MNGCCRYCPMKAHMVGFRAGTQASARARVGPTKIFCRYAQGATVRRDRTYHFILADSVAFLSFVPHTPAGPGATNCSPAFNMSLQPLVTSPAWRSHDVVPSCLIQLTYIKLGDKPSWPLGDCVLSLPRNDIYLICNTISLCPPRA